MALPTYLCKFITFRTEILGSVDDQANGSLIALGKLEVMTRFLMTTHERERERENEWERVRYYNKSQPSWKQFRAYVGILAASAVQYRPR